LHLGQFSLAFAFFFLYIDDVRNTEVVASGSDNLGVQDHPQGVGTCKSKAKYRSLIIQALVLRLFLLVVCAWPGDLIVLEGCFEV